MFNYYKFSFEFSVCWAVQILSYENFLHLVKICVEQVLKMFSFCIAVISMWLSLKYDWEITYLFFIRLPHNYAEVILLKLFSNQIHFHGAGGMAPDQDYWLPQEDSLSGKKGRFAYIMGIWFLLHPIIHQ